MIEPYTITAFKGRTPPFSKNSFWDHSKSWLPWLPSLQAPYELSPPEGNFDLLGHKVVPPELMIKPAVLLVKQRFVYCWSSLGVGNSDVG